MLIDVDPTIVRAGPFPLTWQGIFIALGIVAGLLVFARALRSRGVDGEVAVDAAIWILPPAFVGARLFHVMDAWNYYAVHPLDVFAIYRGGATVYGAVIVGTFVGLLFARRRRLPLGGFFDAAASGQAFGIAVGRIGDVLTGAYIGRQTDWPIGVKYVNPASYDQRQQFVHPVAAYEVIWDLAIFVLLTRLLVRLPSGWSFLIFTILYAFGQIVMGFLRVEAPDVGTLGQAQLIGIVALGLATIGVMLLNLRSPHGSRCQTRLRRPNPDTVVNLMTKRRQ